VIHPVVPPVVVASAVPGPVEVPLHRDSLPSHELITFGFSSPDKIARYRTLFSQNSDLFRESLTPDTFMHIAPLEFPPLKQLVRNSNYPVSAEVQQWFDTQVAILEERGVVENVPEESYEFQNFSPILRVPEEGGKFRLCIAPKVVNKHSKAVASEWTGLATLGDPPPIIPVLQQMHSIAFGDAKGCKDGGFSKTDLCAGYHQHRLAESARRLFGFRVSSGPKRFTRLPFGWVYSGGVFAPAVAERLPREARSYVDDILGAHTEEDDAYAWWVNLLKACRAAGFFLKGSKTLVFFKTLEALGFVLSVAGISSAECRLYEVSSQLRQFLHEDVSPKDLQCVLGLLQWIRQSLPVLKCNFREALAVLQCRQGNSKRKLPTACMEEVRGAIQVLLDLWEEACPLQSAAPGHSWVFHVIVDASTTTVGGVLIQSQGADMPSANGLAPEDRLLAVTSKKLPNHASHWAIWEKESWAVLHSLSKWCQILDQSLGSRIRVWTDNKPLKDHFADIERDLLPSSPKYNRWFRWACAFARFPRLEWGHVPGTCNPIAETFRLWRLSE
jgi:hypothetical protein